MIGKISYKTLREKVVIYVKSKILKGEIKQGSKINENELAKELGISRGPVREALRQIEQEGLVTYLPNKGCSVTTLTPEDMTEMYLIRSSLEALAVKICNGRYSKGSIRIMENAIKEIEHAAQSDDLVGIIKWDQEFHKAIVKESGKKRLLNLWSTTDGANVATFYTMYNARYICMEILGNNHKILLEAIKTGNVSIICEGIHYHYICVPEYLISKLN